MARRCFSFASMTLGASQRWCGTAFRTRSLPANRSSQSTSAISRSSYNGGSASLTQTGMHGGILQRYFWNARRQHKAVRKAERFPQTSVFVWLHLFGHCLRLLHMVKKAMLIAYKSQSSFPIRHYILSYVCPVPICAWPCGRGCLKIFTRSSSIALSNNFRSQTA